MKANKKDLNSNILKAIRQTFLLSIFASVAANAGENPPPDDSEYTVAANIEQLEDRAFQGRSFPRGFTFKQGSRLRRIGDGCFSNASIPSICIPKSVKRIEDRAFFCSRVEAVDLSQCLDVNFGRNVVRCCELLTTVNLPINMISVPEWMFALCTKLASISIPDSVLALQESCFRYSRLSNISLPSHIVSIGKNALGDTNIRHLIIPSSVLQIEDSAVYGIPELTFEPSAQARWFNSNISWNFYKSPKINEAFFVLEIPLSDLIDCQGFNEFAEQIHLGQAYPLNHSVLVRWSSQDDTFPPALNDVSYDLKSRIAQLYWDTRYIYVPGNIDTQFQQDLMNGELQVVQTGFCDQQIKAQAQQAQTRIDAAVQARAKARSGTMRRSRSSGAVNRAGSSSVSSTMSSDAVSKP
ncbi:MAG: leucine-rich repeat domain-containing protein [Holosporales bacterium]|nr:leucine-rich repeat domain-containing protein [Holosporales bacterium]